MGLDGPELDIEEGPEGPGEKLLRTLGGDRGSASPPPRIYVRGVLCSFFEHPHTQHTSSTESEFETPGVVIKGQTGEPLRGSQSCPGWVRNALLEPGLRRAVTAQQTRLPAAISPMILHSTQDLQRETSARNEAMQLRWSPPGNPSLGSRP